MDESKLRKFLRVACHAGALTSVTLVTIGIPIAALLLSDDELVKDSAREAINFSITVILWAAVAGVLWFTLIGIPLAMIIGGVMGLATIILPLMAIVSVCSNENKRFRYPFTFRFFKSPTPISSSFSERERTLSDYNRR